MADHPDIIVNRVANSGILTINLEELYPTEEMVSFDIKDYLYMELILKEKDFRAALKEYDWESLKGKVLLIHCSTDAIIPVWAYMLITAYATPHAADIYEGTQNEFLKKHYAQTISEIDAVQYEQKRVVIKGCSDKPVPPLAYAMMVKKLQPLAQSIMYGEPCSTVPIFKRPRKLT
jgi:hypothetical protein